MSHILQFVLTPQEPNLGRHRKAASTPKEDKRMGVPGLTVAVLVPLGNPPSVPIKGLAGLTDNYEVQQSDRGVSSQTTAKWGNTLLSSHLLLKERV